MKGLTLITFSLMLNLVSVIRGNDTVETGTLQSLTIRDLNNTIGVDEALVVETTTATSSQQNKTREPFFRLDLKRGTEYVSGTSYLNCTLMIWDNDGADGYLSFTWSKDMVHLTEESYEMTMSRYGLVGDRYVSLSSVLKRRHGLSLPTGHYSCQVVGKNGTASILPKLYRKTFRVFSVFNDTCDHELDCGDTMSCVEGHCVCTKDLVHITEFLSLKCDKFNKCLKPAAIGEDCWCDQQCVTPNARCNYLGKCGYRGDFVPFDNSGLSCVDDRTLAKLGLTPAGLNGDASKAPMIALLCLLSTIVLSLGYLISKRKFVLFRSRQHMLQVPSSQFASLMRNVAEKQDKPPCYQDVVKEDPPPSYKEPTNPVPLIPQV